MVIPEPTPEDLALDLAAELAAAYLVYAEPVEAPYIRRCAAAERALADRDDRAVALVRQRDAAEAEVKRLRSVCVEVYRLAGQIISGVNEGLPESVGRRTCALMFREKVIPVLEPTP